MGPTIWTGAIITLALLASSVPAFGANAQTIAWRVDGETRRALVFAPDNIATPAPLILSFHGHGDDMENFQYTNIHVSWPDAIVAYFDGLPSRRDGLQGWQVEKGEDGDRDLRLVDVAIANLRERYKVDVSRIYATGYSNGANFTYLLWAERPSVFAAFAPVAGRLRPSVALKEPKPVLHVGGEQDRQIRFSDQQAAIEAAKQANGVSKTGTNCGVGCTLHASSTGTPVMTWIHPGGHVYPAATSAKIVDFLDDHRLTRKTASQ